MESATRRARTMVRWVLAGGGGCGARTDVVSADEVEDAERVVRGLLQRLVAARRADSRDDDVRVHAVRGEDDGHGVIVAGIAVEPQVRRHGARRFERPLRSGHLGEASQVLSSRFRGPARARFQPPDKFAPVDRDGRANARPRLHFDARREDSTTARGSSFVIATRAARAVDSPIARAFVRRNPPTTRG